MTIDDLVEIGQYLQSLGYGQKQTIVDIKYGAASSLDSDTSIDLIDWYGPGVVKITASPLLNPDYRETIPLADLDEAEEDEIRVARETAPTVGLITSPV